MFIIWRNFFLLFILILQVISYNPLTCMSTRNIFEYFCNLLITRVYNKRIITAAQIVEFWNFVNLDISLILRIKTCIKQIFFIYFVRRKSEANGSVRIVWLSVLYIDMYFHFYSTLLILQQRTLLAQPIALKWNKNI